MTASAPRRLRDLTLVPGPDGTTTVIACDSVGGIGELAGDTFYTDNRTVAHFGARVPLLELICAGATPTLIVNTLSLSRAAGGQTMIDEFMAIARELGIDPDTGVTGSTEDNVDVTATGFGVTVVGTAPTLTVGSTEAGDSILCIGIPLSAPEHRLVIGDPRMPSLAETLRIVETAGVHDALPVGSRGIAAELLDLLSPSGLTAEPVAHQLDALATAGPSTCILVSAAPATETRLRAIRPDLPVTRIATARSRPETF